jgi:hypothetical protein
VLDSSALADAPLYRLQIEPSAANGLKSPSQMMVDKIVAMPRRAAEPGESAGRWRRAAIGHTGRLSDSQANTVFEAIGFLADGKPAENSSKLALRKKS